MLCFPAGLNGIGEEVHGAAEVLVEGLSLSGEHRAAVTFHVVHSVGVITSVRVHATIVARNQQVDAR
jgi:hypothetical protein